jgi:hypothetical protein
VITEGAQTTVIIMMLMPNTPIVMEIMDILPMKLGRTCGVL